MTEIFDCPQCGCETLMLFDGLCADCGANNQARLDQRNSINVMKRYGCNLRENGMYRSRLHQVGVTNMNEPENQNEADAGQPEFSAGLDANALNDAGWEFIEAWNKGADLNMNGKTWSNVKPMVAAAIRKYLEVSNAQVKAAGVAGRTYPVEASDEIDRLHEALIPLANAGFPDERACLTDEDVARALAALYGA